MENRNQAVQRVKPGYKFGRRIGTMFVVGTLAVAIGGLLVLAMGVIQLAFYGIGYLVSLATGLSINSPITAIISILFVLAALYVTSEGFDKQ